MFRPGLAMALLLLVSSFVLLPANPLQAQLFVRGDANADDQLDVSDGVFILNYLFRAQAAPSPPGPDVCGDDPSEDELPLCEPSCR